jgi:hypothetical protein
MCSIVSIPEFAVRLKIKGVTMCIRPEYPPLFPDQSRVGIAPLCSHHRIRRQKPLPLPVQVCCRKVVTHCEVRHG